MYVWMDANECMSDVCVMEGFYLVGEQTTA